MSIGKKLIQIRQERHYSQKNIVEMLDMTQPNYHKLESGAVRAKLDTVEKLASFFGVPIEDLRADDETQTGISQHNHNNEKVITGGQITLNFTDEELVALLKKQLTDKEEIIHLKDEIIAFKDEKIKALEERLGEVS